MSTPWSIKFDEPWLLRHGHKILETLCGERDRRAKRIWGRSLLRWLFLDRSSLRTSMRCLRLGLFGIRAGRGSQSFCFRTINWRISRSWFFWTLLISNARQIGPSKRSRTRSNRFEDVLYEIANIFHVLGTLKSLHFLPIFEKKEAWE